jgi:hypothetical protein
LWTHWSSRRSNSHEHGECRRFLDVRVWIRVRMHKTYSLCHCRSSGFPHQIHHPDSIFRSDVNHTFVDIDRCYRKICVWWNSDNDMADRDELCIENTVVQMSYHIFGGFSFVLIVFHLPKKLLWPVPPLKSNTVHYSALLHVSYITDV